MSGSVSVVTKGVGEVTLSSGWRAGRQLNIHQSSAEKARREVSTAAGLSKAAAEVAPTRTGSRRRSPDAGSGNEGGRGERTDRASDGPTRRPRPASAPPPQARSLRGPRRAHRAAPRREPQAGRAARTLTRPRPPGSGSATLPLHRAPAAASRERDGRREPKALVRCARRDL